MSIRRVELQITGAKLAMGASSPFLCPFYLEPDPIKVGLFFRICYFKTRIPTGRDGWKGLLVISQQPWLIRPDALFSEDLVLFLKGNINEVLNWCVLSWVSSLMIISFDISLQCRIMNGALLQLSSTRKPRQIRIQDLVWAVFWSRINIAKEILSYGTAFDSVCDGGPEWQGIFNMIRFPCLILHPVGNNRFACSGLF